MNHIPAIPQFLLIHYFQFHSSWANAACLTVADILCFYYTLVKQICKGNWLYIKRDIYCNSNDIKETTPP